jgi:hypothetical protein
VISDKLVEADDSVPCVTDANAEVRFLVGVKVRIETTYLC